MRADKGNTRFESCRLQRAAGLICPNERAMDYDEGTNGGERQGRVGRVEPETGVGPNSG